MTKVYRDWRRSESYGIPVSKEGIDIAGWKYKGFLSGYTYGLKRAMIDLEGKHRESKHEHNYYLFAKNHLEILLKEVNQEIKDIEKC